jgi:hypothetical protein
LAAAEASSALVASNIATMINPVCGDRKPKLRNQNFAVVFYSRKRYIMAMKKVEKTLVGAAGAFLLWTIASAPAIEPSGTPYQEIVARNVFSLTNPPPPGPPPDNKPPPPKITLTGIITMNGAKRALMKVAPVPKPGVKPEEQSLILAVGQRAGSDIEVEVLEIDEKAGIVKVNDFGTITNLSFENNGVKLASGPPPGGPPGAGGPPPGIGAPGGQYGYGAGRTIPGRPMRSGPGSTGMSPTTGMPTYTAVGTAPGATTPGTVAVSGMGAPASQPTAPPGSQMTREEATILEAAYALKHQKAIAQGDMPPIPPGNPLVEPGNTGNQGNTTPRSY